MRRMRLVLIYMKTPLAALLPEGWTPAGGGGTPVVPDRKVATDPGGGGSTPTPKVPKAPKTGIIKFQANTDNFNVKVNGLFKKR